MCDRALMALRTVKNSYTDKTAVYSEEMRLEILDEQELTGDMDEALAAGQFVVYFQPQVDYDDGKLIGAEALVRWKHPTRGLIPPYKFIPLFEKNGFISKLDEFVWGKSCSYMRKWLDSSGKLLPISVSVNISRVDIYNKDLCANLLALVGKYDLPPASLRLEITEGVYMEDSEQLSRVVGELQAAGFTVEMDDFGSGYSSLNMLKDVPVDMLKLDMRFLSSSKNEARSGNILSSVIRMARWLRLPIITEGVETREQADYLKNLGACYMQGYYFGRPMPAEEFEEILAGREIGALDRYHDVNTEGMSAFWDASAQNALLFNSYVGGAVIAEYQNGRLEATRLNDNFFKIIGMSRKEYEPYQFDLFKRIDPEYISMAESMAAQAVKSGSEFSYDLKFLPLHPGDEPKWLHIRGRLLARSSDRFVLYLSIEDITERVTLEKKLADASQESQALIDNIPGGIIRFRVEGNRAVAEFVSDGFCRLIGYTPQEMHDARIKEYTDFAHPDEKARLMASERATIEREVPFDGQYRVRCKDGSYKWVMLHATSMYAADGGRIIYGIFTDLTGIKEMEEQLESDKQELESVIRSIPGGAATFEVTPEGYKLAYCSEGVPAIFAKSREEYFSVVHDARHVGIMQADQDMVSSAIAGAAYEGHELDCTFRVLHAEGDVVWINLRGGIIGEKNGHPLLHMIFHNMSSAAELYQDIVDESGTAILVADYNTRELLYINNAAAKFAGKPKEAYAGRKCHEYMMGSSNACDFCGLHSQGASCSRIIVNGRHYTTTFKRLRWNGHDAYIQYLSDITDAWEMERLVAKEKDRLQNIVDNITSGVAVYELHPQGGASMVVYNKALGSIFGIADLGFGVDTFRECLKKVHPDDYISLNDTVQSFFAGAATGSSVFRMDNGAGGWKWVFFSGNGSSAPDGSMIIFSTFTDITKAKLTEERALREKGIVDLVMRSFDICIWKYYPDSGVTDLLGRESCDILPKKRMENAPQSIVDSGVIHPDSVETFLAIHRAVASGQSRAGADIRLLDGESGQRWVRVDYTMDINSDDGGAVGIRTDITSDVLSRGHINSELFAPLADRAKQALGKRPRVELEFLSRMSHDIRTPMNAIIGLTELTKTLSADRPDIMKNLNGISSAGTFLLALLNDALDMSEISRGELELRPEVYPSSEFDSFVDAVLRPLCQRYGVEFIADADSFTGELLVDKSRFNQLVVGLVSNAAKFTPRGGRVEFKSSSSIRQGGDIVDYSFTVKDTGIGMSEEFLQHVFEPCFHSGELPSFSGVGAGLAICKSIVDKMGGSISIKSRVGVGTEVSVSLPIPIAVKSRRSAIPEILNGRRVLLAEDDDISLVVASALLEKAGITVTPVRNGQQALKLFESSADGFYDAVVMDVRMPVMSGPEAARAIRALDRSDALSVPIIAQSANAYPSDVEASMAAGIDVHLAKPLDAMQLFKALAALISGRESK